MSAFVREAIEEKPRRIEQDRVADAVERYCAAGHADEDLDLIATQAIEGSAGPEKPRASSWCAVTSGGAAGAAGGSRKRRPC